MKVSEFQVSSQHTTLPNKLRVIVYDSLDDVRRIGKKWVGDSKPYGKDTYGVTNKLTVYSDEDKPIRFEAIIRLEKDHVPTGLVAHEVCHAAIWFFTQDGNRLHKDSPISKEEKFCYLYGDLFHEVTKKMYKKGLWA